MSCGLLLSLPRKCYATQVPISPLVQQVKLQKKTHNLRIKYRILIDIEMQAHINNSNTFLLRSQEYHASSQSSSESLARMPSQMPSFRLDNSVDSPRVFSTHKCASKMATLESLLVVFTIELPTKPSQITFPLVHCDGHTKTWLVQSHKITCPLIIIIVCASTKW